MDNAGTALSGPDRGSYGAAMERAGPAAGMWAARTVAALVLMDLPERWRHTVGVVRRAGELAATVSHTDRPVLLAAAWLHDIGYGTAAYETGFHPLDGARYLDRDGWPARITGLVAHHSGADFVARRRGLADELGRYVEEVSAVADALTYADQTIGPRGDPVTIQARLAEALTRHGPDSDQAGVDTARRSYLLAVAARVEARLRQ